MKIRKIVFYFVAGGLASALSIGFTYAAKPVKQNQQAKVIKETGPLGIGALKLGMTKEAVEAIGENEPVVLIAPMRPKPPDKNLPPNGADRYLADLRTPFTPGVALPVQLNFTNNVLTFISVQLDGKDTAIKRMAEQVSARYGAGKFSDDMKEEQCIYRNGSNFKIKYGSLATEWEQEDQAGKKTFSVFRTSVFDMCPSSLRFAVPKSEWETLSFEYRAPVAPLPENIF